MRSLRRWSAGALGVVFAYLGYQYLTLPDVRQLETTNPPTTAFMELRAREARARGKQPRRVQHWVSYRRNFAQPHTCGSRRRRRRVLAARRRRSRGAAEIDRARLGARPAAARREHHHAAAREEPVPLAVEEPRQKASRADHRAPARGGAAEGADSRVVPECDRMGRRNLRRRGGRPHVLRDVGVCAGTEGIRAAGRRHHQSRGS